MVDKLNSENVKKKDLELILEVNKKAIEVQMEVAEQNEEIVDSLADIKKVQEEHEKKLEKIVKQSEETNRELFQIKILFVTGLLSLVVQLVQIFFLKK